MDIRCSFLKLKKDTFDSHQERFLIWGKEISRWIVAEILGLNTSLYLTALVVDYVVNSTIACQEYRERIFKFDVRSRRCLDCGINPDGMVSEECIDSYPIGSMTCYSTVNNISGISIVLILGHIIRKFRLVEDCRPIISIPLDQIS